jgi:predicted nucleic acid-binding protein
MLVIDASAVAELILGRDRAGSIATRIAEHDHDLHAPHLLDIEVVSALRGLVAGGNASAERAGEAVVDLADLPITRYSHELVLPRVWDLRSNFSAYDAAYVALAEALAPAGVPLMTADARLSRAARKHTDLEVLVAA